MRRYIIAKALFIFALLLTSCVPVVLPAPLNLKARIHTREVTKLPAYNFSFELPSGWQAQYIKEIEAINIFDPAREGPSDLEKSEIFIRHFKASKFLTLSTVNIISREQTLRANRPAVNYIIEKKAGVPNFKNQPLWRNARHRVLDIQAADTSSSEFYVFAKRPDLEDSVFEDFLNSLKFGELKTSIHYPIKNFAVRITKKPFGIFVTPEKSPVSPERFTGYHTGVDLEALESEQNQDVEIVAMADGKVLRSGKSAGYGGLLVIEHFINKQRIVGVYGHLDPKSLVPVKASVKAGQKIGVLGDGATEETDFERKHLHFGLYKGRNVIVAGYISKKEGLAQWLDPEAFLADARLGT